MSLWGWTRLGQLMILSRKKRRQAAAEQSQAHSIPFHSIPLPIPSPTPLLQVLVRSVSTSSLLFSSVLSMSSSSSPFSRTDFVFGSSRPISALPSSHPAPPEFLRPSLYTTAHKLMKLRGPLLHLAPWGAAGGLLASWFIYPALSEETKHSLIPLYSVFNDKPKEE